MGAILRGCWRRREGLNGSHSSGVLAVERGLNGDFSSGVLAAERGPERGLFFGGAGDGGRA